MVDMSENITTFATTETPGANDTVEEGLAELREQLKQAQFFICPILLVLGILGNIFTILTVSHYRFKRMTSRYILCALAVSDSLLLCTNPFNQEFMEDIWDKDIRALSTFGCKLFFVMYRVGKISASWFIVLVAVERFVAVMFPLKAKILLRLRYIILAILLVYVGVFSSSAVWSVSTGIVDGKCRPDVYTKDTKQLHRSLVLLGASSYSLVPLAILLTLTPIIVYRITRSHTQRKAMTNNYNIRSAREGSKTNLMLIGVVVSYVIWVTPITIVLIITFWNNKPIFGSDDPTMLVLQTVALIFEQINHSSNFFIYVVCSVQFRCRFLQMVRCWCLRRRDSVSAASIATVYSCARESTVFRKY